MINKITIIIICACLSISCLNAQKIDQPYEYPIKPGTKEWKELKTGKEMSEVCQLPQDILEKISTDALIKTCLNYPLIINTFFSDYFQTGFEFVTKDFNGLNELLKRPDAGIKLLDYYMRFNIENNEIIGFDRKFDLFSTIFFELIIAQEIILNQLDSYQKDMLLIEALKKLNQKQSLGQSLYRQKSSALIISRLLYLNNYSISEADQYGNDKYEIFNNYVILSDSLIIDKIKYHAEDYLKMK